MRYQNSCSLICACIVINRNILKNQHWFLPKQSCILRCGVISSYPKENQRLNLVSADTTARTVSYTHLISSTFLQWIIKILSGYFIKIKYFTHVTTKSVSGKLPFPRNRSSPKSTDIEFSIAQAHM